jgi:hypothetical protein
MSFVSDHRPGRIVCAPAGSAAARAAQADASSAMFAMGDFIVGVSFR